MLLLTAIFLLIIGVTIVLPVKNSETMTKYGINLSYLFCYFAENAAYAIVGQHFKMLNNVIPIIIIEKPRFSFKYYAHMNKLRLSAVLLFFAFLAFIIQSCNKDAVTAVAYTTSPIQANIDGATWTPDTTALAITYNGASATKTFSFTGQKNTRQVLFSVTLPNINSTGFPLNTYNIDAVNVTAQYNTQVLTSGSYVFTQQGMVASGAGYIDVTAIDSVKKQITGTFGFYSRSTVYDGSGNVISTTVHNITAGEFTNVPYTFTTN
jgi:hypothetical protein